MVPGLAIIHERSNRIALSPISECLLATLDAIVIRLQQILCLYNYTYGRNFSVFAI